MQAAVYHQLDVMKDKMPNAYPSIVTFGSSVNVFGDGRTKKTFSQQSDMMNVEKMFNFGKEFVQVNKIDSTLQSVSRLQTFAQNIVADGMTALGPAVALSLGMASHFPGSKIMVCTDGQANIGLGSVGGKKDTEKEATRLIYDKLAKLAKENTATVNVLSMRGEDCCLEYLGTLADLTSGVVDIVDPKDLSKIVSAVMSKPILATGVTIKLICGEHFVFSDTFSKETIREFGNVTADTDLTFSFSSTHYFTEPKVVPFQAQIMYSRPDGAQITRTITKMIPIHTNRDDVEATNLQSGIIAMRAIQSSAAIAQHGDYKTARANLISAMRVLQRCMKSRKQQREYINFIVQSEKLDGFMRQSQVQENLIGTSGQNELKDDSAAKNIVQMKQASYSLFASL